MGFDALIGVVHLRQPDARQSILSGSTLSTVGPSVIGDSFA